MADVTPKQDSLAEAIHRTLAEQGVIATIVPWDRMSGQARRPYRDAADIVEAMVTEGRPPVQFLASSVDGRRRPHRGPARVA